MFYIFSSIFCLVKEGSFLFLIKKKKLENFNKTEFRIITKIKVLEYKNSLLSDNLDLDYIETLIRERFLLGKKNEKIYIIRSNEN